MRLLQRRNEGGGQWLSRSRIVLSELYSFSSGLCNRRHNPLPAHPPQPASAVSVLQASSVQRRRLKQLHWDKLKQAREGTVWTKGSKDQLRINYDELESLFQVGGMRKT